MILMNNFLYPFPSEVPNVRFCGSYQMVHINCYINIQPFLLCASSYRKSETILLCSNLVFTIETHGFSNKLTHCWLLTFHLFRPCNGATKDQLRLMFKRILFNGIIGLNFESLFKARKFGEWKIVDLHKPFKLTSKIE